MPVIGFLLYLSISNPKLIHRKRLTSSHNESDKLPDTYSDSASIIADALRYFTVGGLRVGKVQVLNNGIAKYEQLIKSLQKSQKTIDLEYYIYRNDQIGNRITETADRKSNKRGQGSFYKRWLGEQKIPKSHNPSNDGCRNRMPDNISFTISLDYVQLELPGSL